MARTVDKSQKFAKTIVKAELPEQQVVNYIHADNLVHYIDKKNEQLEFSFLYATLALI